MQRLGGGSLEQQRVYLKGLDLYRSNAPESEEQLLELVRKAKNEGLLRVSAMPPDAEELRACSFEQWKKYAMHD
jgi:hypothetical protein